MVKENCGVVGIFSLSGTNVVPMAIDALRALQHRGQEAWGIAIPNKEPLKRLGLVSGASSEFKKICEDYSSPSVIGHVRYSTMGRSTLENAQPLKVKDLCISHNVTIENGQMGKALAILKNEMIGSYCFTFISDDNSVYAARDPKGFRPMVLGYKVSDD